MMHMRSTLRDQQYFHDQLDNALRQGRVSDEMRRMLLALLADMQETFRHIECGRNQWLTALDAMNAPVFMLDSEFRVIRANRDYAERAGMDVRDVIGKPYWQVFPLLDGPSEGCLRGMQARDEVVEELSLPTGQVFRDHSYTVYDDEGRALYSLHVLENITERRRAEAARSESEELFRAIATAAQDAIILLNSDGDIAFWNLAAQKMFGYSRQEAEGQPMHTLIAPERLREEHRKGFEAFISTGQGQIIGKTVIQPALRKDGTEFYAEFSISAIRRKGKWQALSLVRDISERHQVETQLRLFRELLDHSNDAIEVIDPVTHRFLDINDKACCELGYSREELLARGVPDIDPTFGPALRSMVEEQLKKSGAATFETLHQRKDGSTFPVEVSLRTVDVGRPYLLSIARDITERKRAEQTLELSESRLKEAQQVAHLGSWELDLVKNDLWWSDENCRVFGVEPGTQYTYETFLATVHPDDREFVHRAYTESVDKRTGYDIEHRLLMPDGSVKWVNERCLTYFAEDGTPLRSVGSTLDITRRKQTEEELRTSKELLQSIIENAPIRVFWKDSESRFLGCNSAFAKDAGLTHPDELAGKNDFDMAWREQAELYRADDHRVMASGIAKLGYEEQQTTLDGNVIWLRTSKVPMRNDAGEVFGILGIYDDITKLKQHERRIQNLNRTLFTLREVNKALVYCTEEKILIESVCRILVEAGGYRFAWVGYAQQDRQKPVRPVASAGSAQDYLREITVNWGDDEFSRGPTGTAIRTGAPAIVEDITQDTRYAPWREQAVKCGFQSSMALPLMDGQDCFGALNIYASEADAFNEEAQGLLAEMASDLAFGIVTLRREVVSQRNEKQIQDLITHNPDAILILDAGGGIRFANPAAEALLGHPAEHLVGAPFGLPMTTDESAEIEVLAQRSDGLTEPRTVVLRQVDINAAEGPETLVFLHDTTERKKADMLSARLGRLLEHSWNEIYMFTTDTLKFVDVSAGAQQNLGYTLDELRRMTPLDIKPEFNDEQFAALIEPLRQGTEREIQFETEHRRKDGTHYPVEICLQLSGEEQPSAFIAIIQDISERRRYIAELEHKAMYDSLTDLPIRALLQDRLDHALKIALRESTPLAVLNMTILGLNEINDQLGYQNGDRVLQEVASRIQKNCRASDTVARLGDNEFIIVIAGATLESAQSATEKIQKLFELPIDTAEFSLEIEVAFGIAVYPDHGDDTTTLLQRSDIAMRVAKQHGEGISVYSRADDPVSLNRLQLHGELRRAIADKSLAVYYQPKVDIKTGRIMGVEALARWLHPQKGMIPPSDFIPMVEQSGLIRPFTLWILEQAVTQLQRWAAAGIDISIAVNLSTRNLLDSHLPETIAGLLETHQVEARSLCLEITESAIMSRPERALKVLSRLHEMGAGLSIDDFGTGYSSLVYLKKLPVHELKIDKAFVFGLTQNEDDAQIVRSTIELAHNLGLRTVAEGVESKEIMDMLKILKCDIAQGYYLSRPLPAEELDQWLHSSCWGLKTE